MSMAAMRMAQVYAGWRSRPSKAIAFLWRHPVDFAIPFIVGAASFPLAGLAVLWALWPLRGARPRARLAWRLLAIAICTVTLLPLIGHTWRQGLDNLLDVAVTLGPALQGMTMAAIIFIASFAHGASRQTTTQRALGEAPAAEPDPTRRPPAVS
jgi:hypothetical protein